MEFRQQGGHRPTQGRGRHDDQEGTRLLRNMANVSSNHARDVSYVYYIGHRVGLDETTIREVAGNEPWLGPLADAIMALASGDSVRI